MILSDNLLNRQNGCFVLPFIMQDIDETKRRNLIKIIKRLDLKQRRLANMIGQDPRYLNRIIRGHRNLSDGMIDKICKALNLERHLFFLEDNTLLPSTELEKKILHATMEAERLGISHIVTETAEYLVHRIDMVKKQTKTGIRESKAVRLKAHSKS